MSLIRSTSANNGVLITSYNGVVTHKDALVSDGCYDYVVLDEGHKIRNPDSQATLAVKSFPTSHRVILSGSPLQNNLKVQQASVLYDCFSSMTCLFSGAVVPV